VNVRRRHAGLEEDEVPIAEGGGMLDGRDLRNR
jgi:hypothetical protein